MTVSASAPASRSHTRVGFAAMATATLLLPVGDTFAKLLTRYIDPLEVAFWRMLAQAGVLATVAVVLRHRLRGPMFSPIVAGAGLCFLVTLCCLIGAFAVMPIATAISIFFVEPLILTALSAPLLGEKVGPRRYAAVAVGLAGALIAIRPADPVHGWATFLPLGAALAFAFNAILVRKALATRSALTVQCGAAAYAAVMMAAAMLAASAAGLTAFDLPAAPPWAPAAVLAAGATASVSFLLIGAAFARVEASVLAPFQYLEIVGATTLGFLVFREFPDALTWTGTAIILAAGAYVVHRERDATGGAHPV
jgi:drug/metabolite transporter (DMT)-like permease